MTDAAAEVQSLLNEFEAKAGEFINSFKADLERTPAPQYLYHYTDDAGLFGILRSGKIWLTDVFQLNDPMEIRHGAHRAYEALKWFALQDDSHPEWGRFAEDFRERVLSEGLERSAHYFVGCFSERETDLGQWRAYADDGRGYALVFDGPGLERGFADAGEGAVLSHSAFPISYDEGRLNSIQNQMVTSALPFIALPDEREWDDELKARYFKELQVRFSALALHAGMFFKHTAYEGEREYRFVQLQRGDQPAAGASTRIRQNRRVRYVDFCWKAVAPGALREIICGPASDKALARKFAEECIRDFHAAQPVTIRDCNIPYRSFR